MLALLLATTLQSAALSASEVSPNEAPSGHPARLNQFTSSTQERVGLGLNAVGEAVAVWQSRRQEGGTYGVRARRIDASGVPVGDEVAVNVTEAGMQIQPSVSSSPSGATWFAWVSVGQDGDGCGVYARRFAPGLERATAEVRVHQETAGDQSSPSIVALEDGRALCVWLGPAGDLDGSALYGRFLGADGVPSGDRFRLDCDSTSGGCWTPALVRYGEGAAIAHTRHDANGRPISVRLRTVAPDGGLGDEVTVHEDGGIEAVLAADGDRLVAAWLVAAGDGHRIEWRALTPDEGELAAHPIRTVDVEGAGYTSGLAVEIVGERTLLGWSRFVHGEGGRPGVFLATIEGDETSIERATAYVDGLQRIGVGGAARALLAAPDGRVLVAWDGDAGLGDESGAHVTIVGEPDRERPDPVARGVEGEVAFAESSTPVPHDPPTVDPLMARSNEQGEVVRSVGGDVEFRAFSNTGFAPADPEMAVGPDHIVAVVNGGIKIFDKQGTQLFFEGTSGAGGFWGSVGATDFVFDPEAVWDPYTGRYMVMAAERMGGRSYFLFAVSDDTDPTGTWFKYRLNVTQIVGSNIDSVNMSVDDRAIYLTGDWFSPTRYFYYVIEKASVLSNGTPVTRNLTFFGRHSKGAPVNYDAGSPAQYFVWAQETTVGDTLTIYGLTDPLGTPALTEVDLDVPVYGRPLSPPQLGSSVRPLLFEARFWSAVVRNGKLWCTHHQGAPATQRWYEIDLRGWPASGQDPVLLQSGDVNADPGASTFFGSLWVDDGGRMSLTCAHSSATTPISMVRTFRSPSDPPGFTAPLETVITNTSPDETSRWGDYSATNDDPNVPGRFWGHHMYRAKGTWRTRIASVDLCRGGVEPVCTSSPNSVGSGAFIGSTGSASVAADDLTLFATGTAPSVFGLFVYGDQLVSVPAGDGTRCFGGNIWRLGAIASDALGTATLALDIANPPNPAAQITAGSTWVFQYVYRDVVAGGTGFNFSDGLRIQFCD
ncbi:MAG: hypothetical protein AAF726_01870 [Planctomycetota bacterium]